MLGFLSKWIPRATSPGQAEEQRANDDKLHLPLPVTERTARGATESPASTTRPVISAPIPHLSYSLTGFDLPDTSSSQSQLHQQQQHFLYSAARSGSSSASWLNSNSSSSLNSSERIPSLPWPQPPPQVVRLPDHALHGPFPLLRSNSSPPDLFAEGGASGSSTPIPDYRRGSPKAHLKLNTNPEFSRSTQSLQLEPYQPTTTSDVYGASYSYPLAKQLSPIPEQDYFSPDSLRKTMTLPGSAGPNVSTYSIAGAAGSMGSLNTVIAPSPAGESFVSETFTRPSPSYSNSHPFLTRQLNRTVSQTSSRTLESVISSTRPTPSTPATPSIINTSVASSIPPANSPGAYSNHSTISTPLARTGRSMVGTMPTINSSDESGLYPDDPDDPVYGQADLESLHAESFVTASETSPPTDMHDVPLGDSYDSDVDGEIPQDSRMDETADVSMIRSEVSGVESEEVLQTQVGDVGEVPVQSTSVSFASRRRNQDAEMGSGDGVITLSAKRQQLFSQSTPAFWAFWLGFILPPLWLFAGWQITRRGEQPSRMTFWEFYLNTRFWKDVMRGRVHCGCCGQKKMVRRVSWFQQQDGGIGVTEIALATQQMQPTPPMMQAPTEPKKSVISPRLPRWIAEKQSSDDGRARLNDPKRSLRGISFGYPFIPRPLRLGAPSPSDIEKRSGMCLEISGVLGKPNRLLDQMYGVKLTEVRGRPESGRRIIDPWIQRCRYAFCWWLILVCIASCVLSIYLIIYNTRQLR